MHNKPAKIATRSSIFTIVIDAGHGGKDSGAIGANGVQEKQVVLAIAKRLAKAINEQAHMRAFLSRKDDEFVPLAERLRRGRRGGADLFISIHADAANFNRRASGASVYILSQHGASTVAGRWLAERENHSELNGLDLNTLQDQGPMLRSVLIDLAQTAAMRDSHRLATALLNALEPVSPLHYTHVEHAPFLVLKSPDIPSVLVETGFLSNLTEEKRLSDSAYQARLAKALLAGIKQYMQNQGALLK